MTDESVGSRGRNQRIRPVRSGDLDPEPEVIVDLDAEVTAEPARERPDNAPASIPAVSGEELWHLYQEARRDLEEARIREARLEREIEILRSQFLNLQAGWQELLAKQEDHGMFGKLIRRKRRP
jgi:hypothetical protein